MDAARAMVDCSVNLLFVSASLFLEVLILASLQKSHSPLWPSLWACVVLLLAGTALYKVSVAAAVEWGEYLRAASDLYLPPLLNKLGYALPQDNLKEKELWANLSRSFLYQEALPTRTSLDPSPKKSGLVTYVPE